jgi:hypothetical protein
LSYFQNLLNKLFLTFKEFLDLHSTRFLIFLLFCAALVQLWCGIGMFMAPFEYFDGAFVSGTVGLILVF